MEAKTKILEMLANKTISSSDAVKLLDVLVEKKNYEVNKKLSQKKMLKICIWKDKVSSPFIDVSIPLSIVKLGAKFIPTQTTIHSKFGSSGFDFSSLNWDEIFSLASKGELGDIVNLSIDEDSISIKLRIFIE